MNDMSKIPQSTINGPHLTLRPLQIGDAGLIEMYSSDERIARMTSTIAHPLPPGATDAMLARAGDPNREQDIWAVDISAKGGPDMIGMIALNRLNDSQSEITGWVAPSFWNTGAASHAVTTLIEANPLSNTTVFASVFQDNPASARVLTNAGFEYIGDAETFSVARSANVPTWTYLRKLV